MAVTGLRPAACNHAGLGARGDKPRPRQSRPAAENNVICTRRTLMSRGLALSIVLFLAVACRPTPDAALREFQQANGPECELGRPLVMAGEKAVPAIVEAITNPEMPRRRYAIGALGDIGSSEALNFLQQILQDDAEIDDFRADALEAIYKIDADRGLETARLYTQRSGFLGETAAAIVGGRTLTRQGYWSAAFHSRCR